MCKCFKYFCAAALTILSLGVLFKLCHWPGGTPLLGLGVVLGIVAAVWAICKSGDFECFGKGAVILSAVSALLLLVGVFLRVMHYPYAFIFLMVALGILIPISAFWLACSNKSCKK